MNWWFSGKHQRNALETLPDLTVLEFLRQHELARKDFCAAFKKCSADRQEYLQELIDFTSMRDKSQVIDAVEKADRVQRRHNRLAYFHGKPKKRRS